MQTITVKNKSALLSENGLYLILQSDPYGLYVKDGTPDPRVCILAGEDVKYNGSTYNKYASSWQFYPDCLHTAEEVLKNKKLELGGDQSKVSPTGAAFGTSDAANILAANTARANHVNATNDNANPGLGQAYVMVVTTAVVGGISYPYHAAGVVAIDGNDRITVEVLAGISDAQARKDKGAFHMYTVNDAVHSFHAAWSTDPHLSAGPVTIVIEAR
ncbi:hypothetical protein [Tengunoibacter tsumagoiensis]|uniref:Uncharacterized protein n=1 Tax=Tengunoibacter tsumagoiensis TaxID=2014871 RepID=A0A402A926_9CHLR|nr:hypothetical protein [Tengunoibacter tsumagoiensis]GCE15684.1 hypothetical protein KTT_55430 [Tengunoibacter tsumagoiensis]